MRQKNLASADAKARLGTPEPIGVRWRLVPMVVTVMAVMAEEPPMPMMTMMTAPAGLLDRRASVARRRQLAENVAGGRSSLSATNGEDARESARKGRQREKSSHS
jgi:hypothetical protein